MDVPIFKGILVDDLYDEDIYSKHRIKFVLLPNGQVFKINPDFRYRLKHDTDFECVTPEGPFVFLDICLKRLFIIGFPLPCDCCEIVNDDEETRVSVCVSGIVREEGDVHRLMTAPDEDPLDADNTEGINLEYFSTPQGSYRAGNFRFVDIDLPVLGRWSAGFGFHTQATGDGSLVYGLNLTDETIIAEGEGSLTGGVARTGGTIRSTADGSQSHGIADNSSTIQTNVGANGSLAYGQANNSSTIQTRVDAIGSTAQGNANFGGIIETGDNAHGSHAHGRANEPNSIIITGTDAYGSQANGNAVSNGMIQTGNNAHGSHAYGNAVAANGTIRTGEFAFGSQANGNASTNGIIQTGDNANGSQANGDANNGGTIRTGDNAQGSHAHGSAEIGIIRTGNNSFGSQANGQARDPGSIIQTADDACGSHAIGCATGQNSEINAGDRGTYAGGIAENDGKIRVIPIPATSPVGSFVHGIARQGETHEITDEGSVNFGRNNCVTAPYSMAEGHKALAYMYASHAHSGQRVPTAEDPNTLEKGDCQYVRVLAQGTSIGGANVVLALGDGSSLTLPYSDGNAHVQVSVISTVNPVNPVNAGGLCAKYCFCVNVTNGVYTVSPRQIVCDSGAVPPVIPFNPNYLVTSFTDGSSFSIQIDPVGINDERFCATFKITMIMAPVPA